ncbi:helix-turn-helix domain-containing protein [Fibrella aestuarina]|uniref:helix-turn-helix domain-containing protein n=1 Tax=Fibrella aestuarina TaxID=651143 RepID=UPI0006888AC8|nr:helix-turn-helix transcriptional regulator [Fibrella aestuarina]
MKTLGDRIKEAREAANLSQSEVAEKMGLKSGKQTVSKWELNKSEPSLSDLKRLASLLNTTAAYLIDGTIESDPIPQGYQLIEKNKLLEMQEELISYQRKELTRQKV